MWNAHDTVFGSKHSAISAQAVYFLHSMRLRVSWLSSRWWLINSPGNWVMSALSAVLSTCIGRHTKFRVVSCTKRTGQGNDFEFIPTVEIKTRNPVLLFWIILAEFLSICNHCRVTVAWSCKTLKNIKKFCVFLEKRPLLVKFSKFCFKFSSRHRWMCCCVQISLKLADGKSVKLKYCVA